uniref:Uncharacterized protein n=1 Tax=Arundo donax TaxID=35708 RepID=A0A0A9GAZ3_ARUDO
MKYSCLKFANLNFWYCMPPMGGCQLSPHSTCNHAKTRASIFARPRSTQLCTFILHWRCQIFAGTPNIGRESKGYQILWACQNLVGFSLARNQTASVLCKCYQCNGKYVQSQVI